MKRWKEVRNGEDGKKGKKLIFYRKCLVRGKEKWMDRK